jgi:hypothetical protein
MLMALAVLAVIDAVPSPVVEMTLTGKGGEPVSAVPRTLSDVARELREGRKAVGGFSAVETTVPRGLSTRIPPVESEKEATEAEPDVVNEPPAVYVPVYVPAWYGGRPGRSGFRPRAALHLAVPRPGPRHAYRPLAPSVHQPHPVPAGHSRRRV